jgi:hypothetical protein
MPSGPVVGTGRIQSQHRPYLSLRNKPIEAFVIRADVTVVEEDHAISAGYHEPSNISAVSELSEFEDRIARHGRGGVEVAECRHSSSSG